LLNERTKHVLAIGGIKLKAGTEIYAPHREPMISFARFTAKSCPARSRSKRR
jgi:chorismate mutase